MGEGRMQRLVIRNVLVEGVDGAGKSTLVDALHERLDWDTVFLGHREGWQFWRYLSYYVQLKGCVFDRGHISEAVYAELWQRSERFMPGELDLLDGVVRRSMVVIHADPDYESVMQRYRAREQEGLAQQISESELGQVQDTFSRYFQQSSWRASILSYGSRDSEELARLVERVARLIESV